MFFTQSFSAVPLPYKTIFMNNIISPDFIARKKDNYTVMYQIHKSIHV